MLKGIDEARIPQMRPVFDEYRAQDIAEAYDDLEKDEKHLLFDILTYKHGAGVLVELEAQDLQELFDYLNDDEITRFCNEMAFDDAADILGLLEDDRMTKVLEKIQAPFAVKELLSFEPDTCGGLMTTGFISVREDLKIGAALRYVRLKARKTTNEILYIYVTKKFGELVGVLSIRELFLANDDALVKDHLNDDPLYLNVNDDQEEAAEMFSKYRYLAIPVVNENKQLSGIITIDDVVEVIEDEASEDMYQSSGINVENDSGGDLSRSLTSEYLGAYKARTPWLIITLLGQYLAATLIAKFDTTIAAIPIAISFMPLLSGMSGNIGNQSTTIIVRGISTGEVELEKTYKILFHEFIVSLCIGITCATIVGTISYYVYNNTLLSMLIAMSLVASMIIAVSLGTITPLMFKKLNLDPANASGPLITTAIDVISFFVYLTLVTRFITQLV